MAEASRCPETIMLRHTAFSENDAVSNTFSTIASAIARDIVHHKSLKDRLDWLTSLLLETTGIRGVGISALCRNRIVSYILKGINLPNENSPYPSLENLRVLLEADGNAGSWIPLSRQDIELTRPNDVAYVGTIGQLSEPLGMIMVVTDEESSASTLEILNRLMCHITWVCRESIIEHFSTLNAELQDLAFREVTSMEYHPNHIVAELARIFKAGTATILVRDMDRLFVSATTHEMLDFSAFNREVDTIAKYIFETGRIVNLDDGSDPQEILRKTGIKSESPLRAESRLQCPSNHFLGCPIVFRGKVKGIVRILRKWIDAPFCGSEEEALFRFSEILGAHMSTSWRILLGDSLMNSATDAVCVSRLETDSGRKIPRVIFANASAERIFGKSRSDIVGTDAWDLYAPSERERIRRGLYSAIRSGVQEFGPVMTRILNKDKIQRMAEISYRLIRSPIFWPDAKITIGLIRDVTDKHRQEAQHRRLVELLDQKGLAYFRANIDDKILETSKAEENITGYCKDELLGLDRCVLYENPKDRDKLLSQTFDHTGLKHTIQILKKKNGELFYAEGDVRKLHDEETGDVNGYEGLYADVTDRVRIQGFIDAGEDRILTESELLQSLREFTEFHQFYIAGLGHQLRTPLGSLVENLINLQKGITGLDRLDYAIGEARACSLLARNLTYIDKILRAEKIELSKMSLSKLVFETVIDFSHLRKKRKLRFDINRKGLNNFFDSIYGHSELLRQVVVVLLDNAIKYSFEGSEIRIDAKSWSPGIRVFEVYSTGIPVTTEIEERIFERGYRSRLAKDRIPHGTGMGLWLARKIVNAHGADIRCCGNVLGKKNDTVFRIIWPESNREVHVE